MPTRRDQAQLNVAVQGDLSALEAQLTKLGEKGVKVPVVAVDQAVRLLKSFNTGLRPVVSQIERQANALKRSNAELNRVSTKLSSLATRTDSANKAIRSLRVAANTAARSLSRVSSTARQGGASTKTEVGRAVSNAVTAAIRTSRSGAQNLGPLNTRNLENVLTRATRAAEPTQIGSRSPLTAGTGNAQQLREARELAEAEKLATRATRDAARAAQEFSRALAASRAGTRSGAQNLGPLLKGPIAAATGAAGGTGASFQSRTVPQFQAPVISQAERIAKANSAIFKQGQALSSLTKVQTEAEKRISAANKAIYSQRGRLEEAGSAARKAGSAAKNLSGTIKNSTKSFKEGNRSLVDYVRFIAKFSLAAGIVFTFVDGVKALVGGFGRLVATGIAFNREMESASIGIASIIASQSDITAATGEELNSVNKLNAARAISADQLQKLRIDGLKTVATTQELIFGFQQAVGPALAAGITNLDTIRGLTVKIVQGASAIGVPMRQLNEEVRSLLTGAINPINSRLAAVLGITGAMVRDWKSQGILVEELEKRLSAFGDAGDALAQSFEGIVSNLVEGIEISSGTAFSGLFDQIKKLGVAAQRIFFNVETGQLNEDTLKLLTNMGTSLSRIVSGFTDATLGAQDLGTKIDNLVNAKFAGLVSISDVWQGIVVYMRLAVKAVEGIILLVQVLSNAVKGLNSITNAKDGFFGRLTSKVLDVLNPFRTASKAIEVLSAKFPGVKKSLDEIFETGKFRDFRYIIDTVTTSLTQLNTVDLSNIQSALKAGVILPSYENQLASLKAELEDFTKLSDNEVKRLGLVLGIGIDADRKTVEAALTNLVETFSGKIADLKKAIGAPTISEELSTFLSRIQEAALKAVPLPKADKLQESLDLVNTLYAKALGKLDELREKHDKEGIAAVDSTLEFLQRRIDTATENIQLAGLKDLKAQLDFSNLAGIEKLDKTVEALDFLQAVLPGLDLEPKVLQALTQFIDKLDKSKTDQLDELTKKTQKLTYALLDATGDQVHGNFTRVSGDIAELSDKYTQALAEQIAIINSAGADEKLVRQARANIAKIVPAFQAEADKILAGPIDDIRNGLKTWQDVGIDVFNSLHSSFTDIVSGSILGDLDRIKKGFTDLPKALAESFTQKISDDIFKGFLDSDLGGLIADVFGIGSQRSPVQVAADNSAKAAEYALQTAIYTQHIAEAVTGQPSGGTGLGTDVGELGKAINGFKDLFGATQGATPTGGIQGVITKGFNSIFGTTGPGGNQKFLNFLGGAGKIAGAAGAAYQLGNLAGGFVNNSQGVGISAGLGAGAGALATQLGLFAPTAPVLGLTAGAGALGGTTLANALGFKRRGVGRTLSSTAGGAVAGAAVGSIIPGLGTAVGAVVGAVAGSIASFFGGEQRIKLAGEITAQIRRQGSELIADVSNQITKTKNIDEEDVSSLLGQFTETTQAFLDGQLGLIESLPKDIQQGFIDKINALDIKVNPRSSDSAKHLIKRAQAELGTAFEEITKSISIPAFVEGAKQSVRGLGVQDVNAFLQGAGFPTVDDLLEQLDAVESQFKGQKGAKIADKRLKAIQDFFTETIQGAADGLQEFIDNIQSQLDNIRQLQVGKLDFQASVGDLINQVIGSVPGTEQEVISRLQKNVSAAREALGQAQATGSGQQQVEAAQRLQGAAEELFNFANSTDTVAPELFRQIRQQTLQDLQSVQEVGTSGFDEMIDIAKQQLDALVGVNNATALMASALTGLPVSGEVVSGTRTNAPLEILGTGTSTPTNVSFSPTIQITGDVSQQTVDALLAALREGNAELVAELQAASLR